MEMSFNSFYAFFFNSHLMIFTDLLHEEEWYSQILYEGGKPESPSRQAEINWKYDHRNGRLDFQE